MTVRPQPMGFWRGTVALRMLCGRQFPRDNSRNPRKDAYLRRTAELQTFNPWSDHEYRLEGKLAAWTYRHSNAPESGFCGAQWNDGAILQSLMVPFHVVIRNE